MTDEQLHDELERRSKSVSHNSDWARHDLLPTVAAGIDARPQRVATSRWPALAGFAGAVAILLILVVAMPHVVPGPGPSATPVPTGPIGLQVLDSSTFATKLAAGDLAGQTVLVEGSISARDGTAEGVGCRPMGETLCVVGELDGVGSAVEVSAGYMATPEGEGRDFAFTDYWPWWDIARAPVSGTLILRISTGGQTEFVGNLDNATASDLKTVSVSDLANLSATTFALNDAVLVDGWLTGYPPNSCPVVSPEYGIAGLSNRGCQFGWLVGDPSSQPNEGVLVQDTAYYDFANGPVADPMHGTQLVPERGIYAVSKRLEGSGCPDDQTPCWQLEVVGRLSQAPFDNSNGPLATPTPAPTTDTTQDQVLSPRAFAASLLAGDLTGQTVLVNGTINEFEAIDGSVLCKEDGVTCLMGRLQRTDPEAVNIYGRPIDTTEDDPAAEPRSDGGWPWVSKPVAPVTGTLVLSVQEDDTVEFIGLSANGERPALNAEGMSQLSVDATTSGDVYIVDAWLTASLLEPPCAAPDPGTFIGELPNRWCGGPDWLIDEPVNIESGPPPNGLGVQSGAYREFAPDPTLSGSVGEPRFGSYLVSRRLEGWCDGATPPCWQWEVVGRLTQAPVDQPIATPTPTAGATIECVPPPMPPGMTPSPNSRPVVIDETGLVSTCAQTDVLVGVPMPIVIANPFSDNQLAVMWSGAVCSQFTVRRATDGLELAARSSDSDCATGFGGPITIAFTQPMPVDSVRVTLNGNLLADGPPSPVPSPGDSAIEVVDTDSGTFTLMLVAVASVYETDQPIDVHAELLYDGPTDTIALSGVGNLVNGFGVRQLDGPYSMGPGWNEPCIPDALQDGVPLIEPFQKSGGYSEDDPLRPFYVHYFADPEFSLPAGLWEVAAYSEFFIGTCGVDSELVQLRASTMIEVQDPI